MNLSIFELNNYWLPLIWLFSGGLFLATMPRQTQLHQGQYVQRWTWATALLLILPLILWAGARNRFGDTTAYRLKFLNAPTAFAEIPAYMDQWSSDRWFYLLIVVCKCLGLDDTMFFMLIAAFQLLCMAYTFRRYSNHFWICIFLFVASTDYYSWMFNGMRQFISATIIFAAFGWMIQKRYILYALSIIVAAQFHASAYIMLPLSFLMLGKAMNWKTILLILVIAVSIPYIDRFIPFLDVFLEDTQYSGITTDEIWSNDDGTNLVRVLIYSVPALLAFCGWRYVRNCQDPVMNLCINASLITMAIYLVSAVTSGIYVGRIPIYTTFPGYIALPWLIEQIFEKESAKLIKNLMIGFYCAFYYFQTGINWGLL